MGEDPQNEIDENESLANLNNFPDKLDRTRPQGQKHPKDHYIKCPNKESSTSQANKTMDTSKSNLLFLI